jgi:hypothetical protein
MSALGPGGFRVLVGDVHITLPNNTTVSNGMQFRNEFHLSPLTAATLFVPCGGRPESVNISNVSKLYDNGRPRFRAIVEGANLFFTEQARLQLEKDGVIVFKVIVVCCCCCWWWWWWWCCCCCCCCCWWWCCCCCCCCCCCLSFIDFLLLFVVDYLY